MIRKVNLVLRQNSAMQKLLFICNFYIPINNKPVERCKINLHLEFTLGFLKTSNWTPECFVLWCQFPVYGFYFWMLSHMEDIYSMCLLNFYICTSCLNNLGIIATELLSLNSHLFSFLPLFFYCLWKFLKQQHFSFTNLKIAHLTVSPSHLLSW
jgi:hypothetical protein